MSHTATVQTIYKLFSKGEDGRNEQELPDGATPLVAKTAVEVLTLRPTMSYGLSSANEAKRP